MNFSIPHIDSEFLVLCLDEAGIVCSTKSACLHDDTGSPVIRALYKAEPDKGEAMAKSSLRFSLGEEISKADINYVVSVLKREVQKGLK